MSSSGVAAPSATAQKAFLCWHSASLSTTLYAATCPTDRSNCVTWFYAMSPLPVCAGLRCVGICHRIGRCVQMTKAARIVCCSFVELIRLAWPIIPYGTGCNSLVAVAAKETVISTRATPNRTQTRSPGNINNRPGRVARTSNSLSIVHQSLILIVNVLAAFPFQNCRDLVE